MRRTPMQTYGVAGSQLSPLPLPLLSRLLLRPASKKHKDTELREETEESSVRMKNAARDENDAFGSERFVLLEKGLQVGFITSLIFEGSWAQF